MNILHKAGELRHPRGRVSGARRWAAVSGMLAVTLTAGAVASVPAAAATTYRVTAAIGVGSAPREVGVDPAANTIYVTNENDNSVSVIDGVTNTVTATIAVGDSPWGVAVDTATNTIYVANVGGTVSVIDGTTNTLTATIGVGGRPRGVR